MCIYRVETPKSGLERALCLMLLAFSPASVITRRCVLGFVDVDIQDSGRGAGIEDGSVTSNIILV